MEDRYAGSSGDVASEGSKGVPEAIRAAAADAQNPAFERHYTPYSADLAELALSCWVST
jgi:hypothetical protein